MAQTSLHIGAVSPVSTAPIVGSMEIVQGSDKNMAIRQYDIVHFNRGLSFINIHTNRSSTHFE